MANIFKLMERRLHFERKSPISHVMTTELFIINWYIDQPYFSPLLFWKYPTATHSCRGFEDAPDARCDHTTRHVVRSDVLLRKSTMMPSQHRDLGTYLRAWTSPPAAARAHNWCHKGQSRADGGNWSSCETRSENLQKSWISRPYILPRLRTKISLFPVI